MSADDHLVQINERFLARFNRELPTDVTVEPVPAEPPRRQSKLRRRRHPTRSFLKGTDEESYDVRTDRALDGTITFELLQRGRFASPTLMNAMRVAGFLTLGEVLSRSRDELLALKNVGRKSVDDLELVLTELAAGRRVLVSPTAESSVPIDRGDPAVTSAGWRADADVRIQDLCRAGHLSVRTANALIASGLLSIAEVAALSREDLGEIRNLGRKAVQEIETLVGAPLPQVTGEPFDSSQAPRPPSSSSVATPHVEPGPTQMGSGEFLIYLALAADELSQYTSDALVKRLGLDGSAPRTLESIGEEYGVTREAIRQRVVKAFRQIQRRGARDALRPGPFSASAEVSERLRVLTSADLAEFVEAELADLPIATSATLFRYLKREFAWVSSTVLEGLLRPPPQRRQRKQSPDERFWSFVEANVIWSTPVGHPTRDWPSKAVRPVQQDGEGTAGLFYSAKLGRDVEYESLLEREFLLQLERHPRVSRYQEQPYEIGYSSRGFARTYVPDVVVELDDGRRFVTEVKAAGRMALVDNMRKYRALREFSEAAGYGRLITDTHVSIQSLSSRPVGGEFEAAILEAVNGSAWGIGWMTIATLRTQFAASNRDLSTVVLRHRLSWSLNPFSVRVTRQAAEAG